MLVCRNFEKIVKTIERIPELGGYGGGNMVSNRFNYENYRKTNQRSHENVGNLFMKIRLTNLQRLCNLKC